MADGLLRDAAHSGFDSAKVTQVVKLLQKVRNKSVLADVGCFDGSLTSACLGLGFTRVDGFDLSRPALDRAEKLGIRVRTWDFEQDKAPERDETYDAIVCTDVLEHIYNSQNLVRECHRILRKDGKAVFLVPNLASAYNRLLLATGRMPLGSPGVAVSVKTEGQVNLGHARIGTLKEWAGLLMSEGWRIVGVYGLWKDKFSKALTFSRPSLAHSIIFECNRA